VTRGRSMIFRIAVAVTGISSWFSAALALMLAGPGLSAPAAAEEQGEVGVWRCSYSVYGACPPDGVGRAPESFWTYPFFEDWQRIRVSNCRMSDYRPNTSASQRDSLEECDGYYYGIIGTHVYTNLFWAELYCPEGFIGRSGHCIEVDQPREDKTCRSPAGSPVNAATGRNDQTVTDWVGPAARSTSTTAATSRIELRRHYSSHFAGLATPAQSRLGNGWRTSFDAVAMWDGELASARHIHVMLPDFSEITYALEGGVWRPKDSYYWSRSRTDVTATLTVSAGTVTLRQPDGTRYLFNDRGQLRQIIAPDGYTQTLFYRGNLNGRVTDSRGGWIDFTYALEGSPRSGLLINARTSDGKQFIYDYEDRSQAGRKVKDRLTSGTNQWALKAVTYPDLTPSRADNPYTVYHYLDNMYRPYLITAAVNRPSTDRSTWTTTRWAYDVKKRVTIAGRTPGGERWQYAYDDARSQVTVTDPAGVVSTYSRSAGADGLWRLNLLERSGSPTHPSTPSQSTPSSDCWLGIFCPPRVCPIDEEERCRVIKDHCIKSCIFAIDNAALPDLQSMYFNRCVLQCQFDYNCQGNNYPEGWDHGRIGTPRPWLGR
jgi:YD repeat-containing protein